MKIKKIKSQGEFIYPATIAAAVKDANFLKESGSPMTQGEINTSLSENKVDKIEGKGLSTNDFTDDLLEKLNGIESGAQVNTVTGIKGNAETTYRRGDINITPDNVGAVALTEKGAASGVVPLNDQKLIDAKYLPSYVDDVEEYAGKDNFPTTGESGKIYVDTTVEENNTYRWSGSTYILIAKNTNTTYTLSKDGSTIKLTGNDGSVTTVKDDNTTYSNATQTASGLMSSTDKSKLDNLIWLGTQSEYDALSSKSDYTIYLIKEEYVDLGLSSGTLWAKCNIGATKETDYGLFFQWGDTVGYDESTAAAHSSWSTCPGNGGASSYDTSALSTWNTTNLTNNVLNTSVDAAYAHTNGKAKMPTEAQVDELINGTNSEWTTIDGVAGRKFTNKSDSSKYIFIPAAGYFDNGSHSDEGSRGFVWSSSLYTLSVFSAYILHLYSGSAYMRNSNRYYAQSVRGVKNV